VTYRRATQYLKFPRAHGHGRQRVPVPGDVAGQRLVHHGGDSGAGVKPPAVSSPTTSGINLNMPLGAGP